MREIEANKKAWGLLAKDHYEYFKERLSQDAHHFNEIIERELGDIRGKKVIHLQCNTGADTILLAKMGAEVTGVDLVPENIEYARRLAQDSGVEVRFIESDIMNLLEVHQETYDLVFTSEGAIGWLPDLKRWGETVVALLEQGGSVYVMDAHPYFLSLHEEKIQEGVLSIKYPYFGKDPDEDTTIGGYASQPKEAVSYYWMYTVSDLINSLTQAGLRLEFFNEFDCLPWKIGDMERVGVGLYRYPVYKDQFPFSFSLRAVK